MTIIAFSLLRATARPVLGDPDRLRFVGFNFTGFGCEDAAVPLRPLFFGIVDGFCSGFRC
jgi:hypothetical protein